MKYIKTFESFNYLGHDLMNEKIDSEFLQILNEELKIGNWEIPGTSKIETWGDLITKIGDFGMDLIIKTLLGLLKLGEKLIGSLAWVAKIIFKLFKSLKEKAEKLKEEDPKKFKLVMGVLFVLIFLVICANETHAATSGNPEGVIPKSQLIEAMGWIKSKGEVISSDGASTEGAIKYLQDMMDGKIDMEHIKQNGEFAQQAIKNIKGLHGAENAGDVESANKLSVFLADGLKEVAKIVKSTPITPQQ